MNFFFPDRRLLCMAENCTPTLHNLYTPRGAQVRDALAWSKYIDEAIELVRADADAVVREPPLAAVGRRRRPPLPAQQRDLYRYIHDQTMRLANHGETAVEIAETLALPPELRTECAHARLLRHAQPQREGGVPALPRLVRRQPGQPAQAAAGRGRAALRRARGRRRRPARAGAQASFDAGDYRWVAELVNHLVFADPSNAGGAGPPGRRPGADRLPGRVGPWRDAFLTGAQELRNGTMPPRANTHGGYLAAMTVPQLFDSLAVRLRSEDVGGRVVDIGFDLTDIDEQWTLGLAHRALHYRRSAAEQRRGEQRRGERRRGEHRRGRRPSVASEPDGRRHQGHDLRRD